MTFRGANFLTAGKGTANSIPNPPTSDNNFPWSTRVGRDVFFGIYNVYPERWDRLYPYRLLVIDATNNQIVRGSDTEANGAASIESVVSWRNQEDFTVTQSFKEGISSGSWVFNLPITPQQISITDQYAIDNTPTTRGIVEEHNGSKYKSIDISGTTGIWPQRSQADTFKGPSTSIEGIFAGTIEAGGALLNNAQGIARAFGGDHPSSPSEPQEFDERETGYFQALALDQFIERYVQAKKNPAYSKWRLVLDMPKMGVAYVVTPQAFSLRKSQEKPLEHMFQIRLKAWKRVEVGKIGVDESQNLPNLDINTFQRVVNGIAQTRRTLSNAINLVKAVRSDAQAPLQVLRQTALAVKDTAGLAFAVADLPSQLINDYKSSIQDSIDIVKDSFDRSLDEGTSSARGASGIPSAIPSSGTAGKVGKAVNAIANKKRLNEGLSSSSVDQGALGTEAAQSQETDPLNNIFNSPEEYFDLFDEINLADLKLTPQQEESIESELERVRALNIDDFRDFKNDLQKLALEISDSFGAGNQIYSDIYGRPNPRQRTIPMGIDELNVLNGIYEGIQAYDILVATKQYNDLKLQSPLEYVGEIANRSEIEFQNSVSKFPVPVPFGLTIEQIAARYLGNPDRWIEIATINALRSPYIDEEGFVLNFLSNASGRQFTVEDSEGRLIVNQTITLFSDTVPQFTRRIIDIQETGEDTFLITVDGLADLDDLTLADNARVQAYLPGTVNSQGSVFLPSNQEPQDDDRTFDIPGIDYDFIKRLAKVDFLLTDDNDIAINSVGDFRLATGITNLIQALRLAILSKKNSLLKHLDYGLGAKHGINISDVDSGSLIEDLSKIISEDPRFESIERVEIKFERGTLSIFMSVVITGNSGVIPIQFPVRLR